MMFEKILVPLDGSEFSECALEPAFGLAQKFGSKVILLRVTVPEELLVGLPSLVPRYYESRGAENQRDQEEAEAYLYGIKMQWLGAGVPVRTEVTSGTPPELIVELAIAAGAALIVMCTHGRSGFSRLIYGSVAEAVLRGAGLPVMLIPAKV
jgi:nucleotide-binding universal stress UspA family protein